MKNSESQEEDEIDFERVVELVSKSMLSTESDNIISPFVDI